MDGGIDLVIYIASRAQTWIDWRHSYPERFNYSNQPFTQSVKQLISFFVCHTEARPHILPLIPACYLPACLCCYSSPLGLLKAFWLANAKKAARLDKETPRGRDTCWASSNHQNIWRWNSCWEPEVGWWPKFQWREVDQIPYLCSHNESAHGCCWYPKCLSGI